MQIENDENLKMFLLELFKKEVPNIFNNNLKNNSREALEELKKTIYLGKNLKKSIKEKQNKYQNGTNYSDFSIDLFIDNLILEILKDNNFDSIFDWDEDEFEQILSSMTIVIEKG
ncbi:hypothetical protein [Polaribacter atrinae]|uniref:Uncharacterized protein n=1 Tax=Polaribacter atrinae TaxID=1333662 RepID=A0A176T396_9FLAO|nr:hypothetical protein [Polaribacter atrinae]OAD42379.1 hypothetical protein LPB303_14875 [Polaribacter atrinae]